VSELTASTLLHPEVLDEPYEFRVLPDPAGLLR
jgi:hypothetical protein